MILTTGLFGLSFETADLLGILLLPGIGEPHQHRDMGLLGRCHAIGAPCRYKPCSPVDSP